jgi:acyl-CoA synthetase (AMP-forming)/AMP-acid ligase II
MATVQEDGAIVFLGRGSACINTGGEKVFAEEVEELLKAHPAVRDAIVVGLPDPRWGQRVVGLVTARGGPVDEETVLAWCRGQIAAYKVPKQLFVVESLARQPSGKPDYPGAQAAAAALAAAT